MSDKTKSHKLIIDDEVYETRLTEKYKKRKPWVPVNPRRILAVIPGVIIEVSAKEGRSVKRGDSLLVVEAMKMKNDIFAPLDAKIGKVHVQVGDITKKSQLLIELV